MVTLLGLLAGLMTTVAFVPQVIKTWRTQATHDISLATFAIFTTGVFAWLVYGIVIRDAPLIMANAVTFVLAGTILYLKIKNG
ncbi:Sugar transporter SemiSWEET [Hyphomicrobium sp. 1Nfss2.1]|uniref:SemiSWEET transporter n=1 Tax=unclassified Hyphomicrobium TaxID=2619925 RepID=UPI000930DCD3|nr:SemiSWEET transporter [Hyphomicrobium sp. NDB2Meth4]